MVDEGDRRDVNRALLVAKQYAEGRGEALALFAPVELPEAWRRLFERQAPGIELVESDAPADRPVHVAAVVCCPCVNCTSLALTLAAAALRVGGQMIVDCCAAGAQARESRCTSFRVALRWFTLRAFGLVEPAERRRDWRVVTIGADVLVAERI